MPGLHEWSRRPLQAKDKSGPCAAIFVQVKLIPRGVKDAWLE